MIRTEGSQQFDNIEVELGDEIVMLEEMNGHVEEGSACNIRVYYHSAVRYWWPH